MKKYARAFDIMKLTVKNFGPIREAKDVVVSPMTVFVGPSNTGKSYLAILIYSIMQAMSGRGRLSSLRYALDVADIFGSDLKSAEFNNKKNTLKIIENVFFTWANFISKAWKGEVPHCFGVEGENMITHVASLVVKISDMQEKLHVDLCSPKASKLTVLYKNKLFASIEKDDELKDHLRRYANMQKDSDRPNRADRAGFTNDWVKTLILDRIVEILLVEFLSTFGFKSTEIGLVESQSHYLPAIRGGIMQSHRTLVSALIARAPTAGLHATSTIQPFTGVLSDFMTKLININNSHATGSRRVRLDASRGKSHRAEMSRIGAEVEQKIMDGKIDVQISDTQYPDFRYAFKSGGKKHDLPLMSVSSMVSELAPVSLFIRYYVKPGDLFIVEEPEAHLHPGAQRAIVNILVQLVNAGIRVMITTHSDTVLEQISNYVHAFEIDKKIQGQSLSKEKIAAYLFDRPKTGKNKNTKVEKISFHPVTGILTADHLAVSSSLYNESVDLLDERES